MSGLPDGLTIAYEEIELASLKPADRNARYMERGQFTQLIDNLKRDKVLTSAPLVHQGRILSGHHRVEAAVAAGIKTATCCGITSDLTPEQATAIQLSHNAIVGQDHESVLREMYEELAVDDRLYSGVDENDLAGSFETWQAVFDAVVDLKSHESIMSTPTALHRMAEITREYLAKQGAAET